MQDKPTTGYVSRLSEEKIGQNQGGDGESIKEIIKKWAKENAEFLQNHFRSKYGQFVGDKCLQYYTTGGEMPDDSAIRQWKIDAKILKHSIEPDQGAVQFIQRDKIHQAYASLVGEERAVECVDLYLATGEPIHRDMINQIRDKEKGNDYPASENTVKSELDKESLQTAEEKVQARRDGPDMGMGGFGGGR